MADFRLWLASAVAISAPLTAQDRVTATLPATQIGSPAVIISPPAAPPSQVEAVLPADTPLVVMLELDLTTTTSNVGDIFPVSVVHDVVVGNTIVIPQGTIGAGEVTFVTKRGGFGKGGIIGITLRDLQLGGRKVALDGHYREEGKSRGDATAATFFAVGILSGFIKGNDTGIPKGRELRARTAEDFTYTSGVAPSATPAAATVTTSLTADKQPASGPATSAIVATPSIAKSVPAGTSTGEKK
jgi:hypothetical protein